jgi:hypothetical protein
MVLDMLTVINDFYCNCEDVFANAENQLKDKETTEGGNMNVGSMQDTFQRHMSYKIKDFWFTVKDLNNGCFTTGEALKTFSKRADWTGVLFLGFQKITSDNSNNDNNAALPSMALHIQSGSIELVPNRLVLYRSRWTDLARLTDVTGSGYRPLFQMFFYNTHNSKFLQFDHHIVMDRMKRYYKMEGLLTKEKCDELIATSEQWVKDNQNGQWDTKRHEYYPTTDIPVNKLPYYQELSDVVKAKIFPEISKNFMFPVSALSLQDFFIIKYDAKAQHKLDWHRDVSLISFNFCLNSDFEGGGTRFQMLNETVRINAGEVVMHSGKVLHAGNDVTKGIRYIVVGFVRVDDPRVNYEFIQRTSKSGISDADLLRNVLLY